MSTETKPTEAQSPTPIPVAKATSPEVKLHQTVVAAAAHADKPQPADKKTCEVPAAHANAHHLKSLLAELASPESIRRATAAAALGRTADAAAVSPLIAALGDPDADVARESAASLGLLRNVAAVEPLIVVLNNRDGYFHVVTRIAATHSLAQIGDLRAVQPLLDAIRDPIAEASAEAIRALAALPDPRSLPAFLQVVRNENGYFLPTTRHAAILGLAKIGGAQAVCELRFVAGNQWEDATIRATAIEVTGEAKTPAAGA